MERDPGAQELEMNKKRLARLEKPIAQIEAMQKNEEEK